MTDTEKAALERRIDELCAEVERLRQELAIRESSEQEKVIDYLGKECVDWEDKYLALADEDAKLREAVATAIKVQTVLCGDADSIYCRKECPLHRQESDDCLACDVIGVAQELGIEVNP